MTTTDIFGNRATLDRSERAQTAVKNFRSMLPTVNAFARALTGRKDVKVVLDSGTPRTDGDKVYYHPPISLGDRLTHQPNLCEKRDSNLQQRCAACARREDIMVTIYHELGHIIFGTFEKPSNQQRAALIKRAVETVGGERAKSVQARMKREPWKTEYYMDMASLVSEYLPFLINALDDARVNREMFKARPGMKPMFEAQAWAILNNGVERDDETIAEWKNMPLDAQAGIGVLCKAAGYTFDGLLDPRVELAMADKRLTEIVNRMDSIRSMSGVYELSYPVLQRLQELGFMRNPDDEPEEPENEPTDAAEDDSTESNTDQDGDSDDDTDPAESGEGADGSGDAESAGEPDAEGGDDDSEGDDTGDDGSGDSDSGPADGLDDGDPGQSGGSDSADGDSSEDAGDSSDGDAGAGPEDEAESGDSAGEAGTGDIGDDPESGDTGGEAGSGDGDRGEESGREADGNADSPESGAAGGSGSGDGDTDESNADGAEGGEAAGDGSEETESGESSGDADSDSGEPAGPDSDVDMGAEGNAGQEPVDDPSGTPSDATADDTGEPEPATGDPIDTGADDGDGGIDLTDLPELPQGSAEDMSKAMKQFGGHDETKVADLDAQADEEAIKVAVVQGEYFEKPSENVSGVNIFRYDKDDDDALGWNHSRYRRAGYSNSEIGIDADLKVPESVLGPVLQRLRVAFSDNRRAAMDRNRKSGRVSSRVLGKRAWGDDERLFAKKTVPAKKDYFVVLGVDISGSTVGVNIGLAKRAAMAYAEMLSRLGIPFAVYAHTATRPRGRRMYDLDDVSLSLDMYEIKSKDDPWSTKQVEALANIGPVSDNLDGHSLEFYRKRLDESRATNKVMLYFTDGKMPAANYTEELDVLQTEIATCKRKGYTLLGVGIRTDSPQRHGLDTVQVDTDEDLIKVVRHLEKELA